MKNLFLCIACLVVFNGFGQQVVIDKTDKETFYLNNAYNFTITREDAKTKKQTFEVILDIPSKKNKEYYYPDANFITTTLVGNEIQIIYDIFNKKESKKFCYIKTLNTKGAPLSDAKELGSVFCNTAYSVVNTIFKTIYSPDKTKFALLLDNYKKDIVVEPSITVYDAKKQTVLATKQLKSAYNGNKMQIDGNNNFKMDNAGNITLQFNTLNNETNLPIKTYQAELPFTTNELQNVKENSSGESNEGIGRLEQGRFYKSLEDYLNNKPMEDYKIKVRSYSFTAIVGESFKVIDKVGETIKTDASKLPSEWFTYKGSEYDQSFYLMKIHEGVAYIVLVAGKLSYYARYSEQSHQYYSEGITGDLKKFKSLENNLDDYLKKYNLLDEYNKDKPKREFKDNVNDYFNKQVAREIKYFNLLNEKMK